MDILLTTFPRLKTKNVGDALITESAIRLVRHRVPTYDPVVFFREESLEGIDKEKVRTILAPGFSVNNDAYPELFKMYPDVSDVLDRIYVTGCSFQHLTSSLATYQNYEHNKKTKEMLKSLSEVAGSIPCRDELIHEMLLRNDIKSSYVGDLALYDDNKISTQFVPPKEIRSVAFTVQHNGKFLSQSKKLLSLIKREFGSSELYVVHHSTPNKSSKKVSDFALSLGYIEKGISGEAENLSFYDGIDLHIGYRLHGHIFFLRNRKPSFLMAEDCRSFGISKSGSLRIGITQAMESDGISVRDVAPYELMKYVRRNINNSFSDYQQVFRYIDESYYKALRPFFDDFCLKLGWKPSVGAKIMEMIRASGVRNKA